MLFLPVGQNYACIQLCYEILTSLFGILYTLKIIFNIYATLLQELWK